MAGVREARGILVGCLAVALGLVLVSAPAAPAQDTPTLSLDPTSGPVGSTVEATGTGYPGGFTATLRLDDPETGPLLADDVPITPKGTFETSFTVPRGVAPGLHRVRVCVRASPSSPQQCDGMPSARFTVTAAPTTTAPTTSTSAPGTTVPGGTVPPGTTQSTAVVGTSTSLPDDLGVTTTTHGLGVGDLAGPTTTHGLGFGDLAGINDLPDLSIAGFEITQGIQNLDNDMPLVANRTTVLRVYVQTDGDEMPHVSGVLQLVRDGDDEVAVIEPDNGPLTVGGDPPDRLDVDASLNFTLPPEAITATSQGDRLVATAFVFGTHPTTPALYEPTAVNNYEGEVFEFFPVGDFLVHWLPMHMHELPVPWAPVATYGTDPSDAWALAATMMSFYRYHPVAKVVAIPGVTVYPPLHGVNAGWLIGLASEWNLELDDVQNSILAAVQQVWAETSPTSPLVHYYGVYREDLPRKWGGFSNGTVAYGYYDLAFGATTPWYHRAGWLMAHELGHSIGFAHVACSGSEENPGSYPWADPCTMAPVDPDGYFGWDIRHDAFTVTPGPTAISNDPSVVPHHGFPYMGYQSSKWTDPWHYCRALVRFGVPCTAVPIPENAVDPPAGPDLTASAPYQPLDAQTGWLRVGVLLDGTGSKLVDAQVVAEPLPHVLDEMASRRQRGTPTDVSVALVGADGSVLHELPLVSTMEGAGRRQDDDLAPLDGEPATLAAIDYLPWLPGVRMLQVRVDGAVVHERAVSTSAPTITVLAPTGGPLAAPLEITWEAADADGDELAFDLAYSPDGGTTWTSLAQLVGGRSYTVADFARLGGGDEAVFRVTARDGVHATSATSAPGVVPDQGPTVLVLSPGDGSVVPLHRAVTLLASVWDHEDGGEGDTTVAWSSDRDGPLGAGPQLVVRTLSAGDHLLTATATDASGQQASHAVTITVDADAALDRLDEDGFAAALAALRRGPSNEPDGGTGAFVWVLAGLAVLAAAGGTLRWRRRSTDADAAAAAE